MIDEDPCRRQLARLDPPTLGLDLGLMPNNGAGYHPFSQAYFGAHAVQESSAVKRAVDLFVRGLITDGSWPLLDRLLLPMGTQQATLVDLKQPAKSWSAVSAPTFTAYRGFTGNGSTSYVSTGENVTVGPNFSQNSAMIFVYVNQQSAAAGAFSELGQPIGSANSRIVVSSSGVGNIRLNGALAVSLTGSASVRMGSRMGVRTSSSNIRVYVNGTNLLGDVSNASEAPIGAPLSLLRENGFSDDRVASGGLGAALSNVQAISLQDRLHNLMILLGANY